jgi:phosphoribosylglycinamide formyltransferase-1
MSKAIVILCSGGGGNLRFVYHAIRHGWIPLSKVVVIADRECLAMNFARQHGLANSVVNFKEVGQVDLIRITSSFNPGLIITTVHQILSPSFLSVFHIPILNLHYSLLPAFYTAALPPNASPFPAGVCPEHAFCARKLH